MENFAQAFKEFDSKSFMGKGGFVWWYGVVEDRNDPLFLGRLKVRCIGWHTDDKTPGQGIPTEDLPWAQVLLSPQGGSGKANRARSLRISPGDIVMGFFLIILDMYVQFRLQTACLSFLPIDQN